MRSLLLLGLILALTAQQGPPPGNPDHKQPPAGWYCQNYAKTPPAHRCECDRKCELQKDGSIKETEDSKCRAWCFRSYCRCVSDSCDGNHH